MQTTPKFALNLKPALDSDQRVQITPNFSLTLTKLDSQYDTKNIPSLINVVSLDSKTLGHRMGLFQGALQILRRIVVEMQEQGGIGAISGKQLSVILNQVDPTERTTAGYTNAPSIRGGGMCHPNIRALIIFAKTGITPHTATTGCSHLCPTIPQAQWRATGTTPHTTGIGCSHMCQVKPQAL